jgi:hypothetical protein
VANERGQYSTQQDVPGALEAIERVGWRLKNVGYCAIAKTGQTGGMFDSASVPIVGIYIFRRPSSIL